MKHKIAPAVAGAQQPEVQADVAPDSPTVQRKKAPDVAPAAPASYPQLSAVASELDAARGELPGIVGYAKAVAPAVEGGGDYLSCLMMGMSLAMALETRVTTAMARKQSVAGNQPAAIGGMEWLVVEAAIREWKQAKKKASREIAKGLSPKQYKGSPIKKCRRSGLQAMFNTRLAYLPRAIAAIDARAARAKDPATKAIDAAEMPGGADGGAVAVKASRAGNPEASGDGAGTSAMTGEAGLGPDGLNVRVGASQRSQAYAASNEDAKALMATGVGGAAPAPLDGVEVVADGRKFNIPLTQYDDFQRVREEREAGETLAEAARRLEVNIPALGPAPSRTNESPPIELEPARDTTKGGSIVWKDGKFVVTSGTQETSSKVRQGGGLDQTVKSRDASIAFDGETLEAGHETSSEVANADGSGSKNKRAVAATLNPDGSAKIAGTFEKTAKDAGGDNERGHSGSGSLVISEDKLAVAGEGTVIRGDRSKTVGGEIIHGDNEAGLKGKLGAGREVRGVPISLSVEGGYKVTLNPPRKLKDGRFEVVYEVESSAGGGAKGSDMGPGKSLGATAGASRATKRIEKRVFKRFEDANSFYQTGRGAVAQVANAEDVAKLEEGSEVSTAQQDATEAGLELDGKFIKVGVAISEARSKGLTIRKGKGSAVTVTLWTSDQQGVGAQVQGTGIGGAVSFSETSGHRVVVSMDLSTRGGQAALSMLMKHKKLPQRGYSVLERASTDRSDSGNTVDTPVVKVANSGHASQETAKGPDGVRVVNEAGRASAVDLTLKVPDVGKLLKGEWGTKELAGDKLRHSHGLRTEEIDGEAGDSVARSEIDSTHASDAAQGLADALDEKQDVNVSGGSAGKWTVQSSYSPAQIKRFLEAVERGGVKPPTPAGRARIKALRGGLRRARNEVERAQAFNKYVKAGGASALTMIKRHASGRTVRDLKLDGSAVFDGAEGRAARASQLEAFEQRVATLRKAEEAGKDESSTRATLTRELKAFRAAERARLRSLSDGSSAREVPPSFRKELVQRAKANIRRSEGLMAQARPKGDPLAGLSPEQRAMQEQFDFMDRRAADLQKAARLCEWHRDGHNGRRATAAASRMLSGKEEDAYTSIRAAIMWAGIYAGMASRKDGWARVLAKGGAVTQAKVKAKEANDDYGKAINNYQIAVTHYEGIQRRWQKKYPGYFKGLHRPPS